MRSTLLVALSIGAITTTARAQVPDGYTPVPSITLPAELDRVLRDYERGWQSGDEAGLAAIFTADGFAAARQGWIRGPAAIRSNYASAQGPLRLRALACAAADTVGYIVGAYGYGPTADVPDTGKFLLALRRVPGGQWLIAADLDAGNR